MKECRNCNCKLSVLSAMRWATSGVGELKCPQCSRVIAGSASLLIIYAFAAVLFVLAVERTAELQQLIGFNGPEAVAVLLFGVLCIAYIYLAAIAVEIFNA